MFKKKKTVISTPEVEINEQNFSTTEESLKSDSSIVIGEIKDNAYVSNEARLPNQIDIEARRKQKIDSQYNKNKKAILHDDAKEDRIVQSITALVVLLLFGFVYGVYNYYKNYDEAKNLSLRKVHVEYGSAASLRIADYVNVKNPDEKNFYLDLSDFVPDMMGEYKYWITYSGSTREGVIEVSDTIAPVVEVKEVTLSPGDTYTPEMFVNECVDINKCFLTFEDGSTIKTVSESDTNTLTVFIVAKDSYGNQERKQAKLNIKSTNLVYSCSKVNPYDYNLGYRNSITYKLVFDKFDNYIGATKYSITEYVDNNDYMLFKKGHSSSIYEYDDSINKVSSKETYKDGFNNNTSYTNISKYLSSEGYTCVYSGD